MQNKIENNLQNNSDSKNNFEGDLLIGQEVGNIEQNENKTLKPEILESKQPLILDTPEISQRILELPLNIKNFLKSFDQESRKNIVSDQFLLEHNNEEINQYYNKMKEKMLEKIISTNDYPLLK